MAGRPPGQAKSGGRKLGVPNKATAELKVLAGVYTVDALKELARIMNKSESDQARVSAANSLLDRAHGKPRQEVDTTGEFTGTFEVSWKPSA